jgi:nitroreductase/ketosteroid isomerase-like protein
MIVVGGWIAAWLVTVSAAQPGDPMDHNRSGLTLRETFDLYVQSIQASDIEALFTTVTDRDSMVFIDARGRLIDTRQGYYEFHEGWFTENDWAMPVELLEVQEGQEYGYTVARFHYQGGLSDTTVHHLDSYFTLIFHKEDGMWKVVADLCSPVRRYQVAADSQLEYDSEQSYLLNIIRNRRTVRKFKPDAVPEEHIRKILDAARYAPTAGNQQPWRFLVIRDRAKLDRLGEEALDWYAEAYFQSHQVNEADLKEAKAALQEVLRDVLSAPVYVAVLVESASQYPEYVGYDGALAAGYLMIAARSLGYGTGFFTTFFPGEKMREFFGIPECYRLICFTPIGIPDEWPEMPTKKDLDEMIVFDAFPE